jgi:hypothetical protein
MYSDTLAELNRFSEEISDGSSFFAAHVPFQSQGLAACLVACSIGVQNSFNRSNASAEVDIVKDLTAQGLFNGDGVDTVHNRQQSLATITKHLPDVNFQESRESHPVDRANEMIRMLTGNNDKKKDCVVLLNSGRHWICVYGFMKEGEIMKWLIMNPLNSTDKSRTNQQLAQMLVGTPNYSQTGRIQQLGG